MTSIKKLSQTPITDLAGIGDKTAKKLSKLGLESIYDLLMHLPHRYENRALVVPIKQVCDGDQITVVGRVTQANIKHGRRKIFNAVLHDGTGIINVAFFSYFQNTLAAFKEGSFVRCHGRVKVDKFGPQMTQPDFESIQSLDPKDTIPPYHTPVYPQTKGVSNLSIKGAVQKALSVLKALDSLPLQPEGGTKISFSQALEFVHNPSSQVDVEALNECRHPMQQALVSDELLAYAVSLLRLRSATVVNKSFPVDAKGDLRDAFLKTLPFSPTGAQNRVVSEIDNDLSQPHPMMRLVQGDVGSGKTLVAALAALSVIEAGKQVALMAPTEILAEQHANGFSEWFSPLGITVGWLAGKMTKKAKMTVLGKLASGEIQILIGTHAIFQDSVDFSDLGLMIIDEQHRFGVQQRMALRSKGGKNGLFPHQLVMTATPIPRTLAMVAYADLDTSIIDELPPGRTPIKTVVMANTRRAELVERIRFCCTEERRQVYWVCTLIDESESLQSEAASEVYEQLVMAMPELRIGLVHGKMKAQEKQAVMDDFKNGNVDVLVATTVIEVGVNVPNASLMVIENPERLGLAQLHQLRGRVGRGSVASHCVLMYHPPLPPHSLNRLSVLRESNDGFVIAQKDLELRGPGELLGVKQTGMADLRVADLARDADMIPSLQRLAGKMLIDKPECAESVMQRWLLDDDTYGNV